MILIEDIVDSGLTMTYLLNLLGERKPASLRACSLLVAKDNRRPGSRSTTSASRFRPPSW
ncbi:MAG: phosphoribosyltransferase family protein [Acidimicrobiales bacterium]